MTILVRELRAEIEVFKEGCRKLAFQLGAGGYNADEIMAGQLIAKIQGGLDLFCDSTSGWVQKLEAERDQLKAENAELRRDAEFFRFIEDCPIRTGVVLSRKATEDSFDLRAECERIMSGIAKRQAMTKEGL